MKASEILQSAKRIVLATLCFMGVIALGASGWFILFENGPDRPGSADSQKDRTQDFETTVYARLFRLHAGTNLVFSPLALRIGLMMVRSAAREETRAQVNRLLYPRALDASAEVLAAREKELLELRNGAGALKIANRMWLQRDYDIGSPYLSESQKTFGLMPGLVGFQGASEEARLKINTWFVDRLGPMAVILGPGTVDSLTRFLLTSGAVYQGDWNIAFSPEMTDMGEFTLESGKTVKVQMMHADGRFRFGETKEARVIELPSKDRETSLLVMLPNDERNLESFVLSLDLRKIAMLESSMRERQVEVTMPRFQLTKTTALPLTLAGMGMEDAFDPNRADFTGFTGHRDIFLNTVLQRAVFTATEGTERTAGREEFGTMVSSGRHSVFRVTRPFIFLLRHGKTNTILLLGHLADPRD